ncbi:MAG: hypothetical protein ACLGIV_05365, partial [Actinomycetes bacterium]
VEAYGSYTVPAGQRSVTALSVAYDGGASPGGFDRTLSLYNVSTGSWEVLRTDAQSATDVSTTIDVAGDPMRFVSSAGEIRLRVAGTHPKVFDLTSDLMTFTVTHR